MPDTTETIVIRWLVDNKDAIARHQEFRKTVETIREQLKQLSQQSNATYKEMANAMVKSFASNKIEDIKKNNPIASITEVMQLAKPEIAKYRHAMSTALADLNTQTRVSGGIWNQSMKDRTIQTKNAAAQQVASLKQVQSAVQTTTTKVASSGGGVGGGGILSSLFGGGLKAGLGGLLGLAGGIIGITSAMAALKQAIGFLGQAAEQGQVFAKSLFAMEVGVRALQRAGVDITIKEMYQQIDILKTKFGVFSKTDLIEGSAAFLNLNRDMGFTKEQLFELQEAIATLAIVNGRSMDEVQKTVALALSSGYTEGLQRLGVSINRVTIAAEAASMGWKNGYTSLTEVQRAAATYNLVIRKTAIYQEDLLKYQKTLPGEIDTATKAIQDQTVAIGQNLLGVKLWVTEAELSFLRLINAFTATKAAFNDFRVAFLKNQADIKGSALTQQEINRFSVAAGEVWEAGVYRGGKTPQQMFEQYQFPSEKWNPSLGDTQSAVDKEQRSLDAVKKIVDDKLDEINKIKEQADADSLQATEDFNRDMIDLETDYYRDLTELEKDWLRKKDENQTQHFRKETDMATEYQRDIDDITNKTLQQSVDTTIKYNQDVANTWKEYYSSIADAQAKYQNQQMDAEVAFQEKMRRLREGMMFDLEDALRARDARQVLQLVRRYNLEKTQGEREYQQQKDKAARDFDDQMAQLARQRDERLANLYAEMMARLAAITEEARKEKEDRDLKWEQDKIDEDANFQQKQDDEDTRYTTAANDRAVKYDLAKADRDAKWRQELIDIQTQADKQYAIIAGELDKELGHTALVMGQIQTELNNVLGPGGASEKIYKYYAAMASAYMRSITGMLSQPMIGPPVPTTGPHAKGGIDFANTSTQATFGEAGPEIALFVPLNKRMSELGNNLSQQVGRNVGGNGNGRVAVEILLDPRLEGRIVDTTIDNVADVIIRRLR